MRLGNPQDEFAALVEDIRLGLLHRPYNKRRNAFDEGKTAYEPFRVENFDLSQTPVFYFNDHKNFTTDLEDAAFMDIVNAIDEDFMADQFQLPFPAVALMWDIPGEDVKRSEPLRPHLWHDRVNLTYLMQEPSGIVVHQFTKHDWRLTDHWLMQSMSMMMFKGTSGKSEFEVGIDPKAGFPPAFAATLEQSLYIRGLAALVQCYRIVHGSGQMRDIAPTASGLKIMQRREKLNLPPVQQVRIIDLTLRERVRRVAPTTRERSAREVRPHWRHAHFRQLKNGVKIKVKHSAVKGGGGAPPPWYYVNG